MALTHSRREPRGKSLESPIRPGDRFADDTSREKRRLTADLPVADAETLSKVAADAGTNKVTALVRAIRVLAKLSQAERDGATLTLTHADGSRERLTFM